MRECVRRACECQIEDYENQMKKKITLMLDSSVAIFVETSTSVPFHASDNYYSRAHAFSGWSSCDCEKSLSRPAHCNTSCFLARIPPGCAKDDGAPDHQEDDCCVIKNKATILCLVFYMCVEMYIYM